MSVSEINNNKFPRIENIEGFIFMPITWKCVLYTNKRHTRCPFSAKGSACHTGKAMWIMLFYSEIALYIKVAHFGI